MLTRLLKSISVSVMNISTFFHSSSPSSESSSLTSSIVAFLSPVPHSIFRGHTCFPHSATTPIRHASIYMKRKSSNGKSKSVKGKRPSSSSTSTASMNSQSSSTVPSVSSSPSTTDVDMDTQTSTTVNTSSSKGFGTNVKTNKQKDTDKDTEDVDPTRHRVRGENPVNAMQDPSKDLREQEAEPLKALPVLSDEEIRSLRFDLGTPLDTLIEYFEQAQSRDDFPSVMVANRHHITETLLYRFTSAILQVESQRPKKRPLPTISTDEDGGEFDYIQFQKEQEAKETDPKCQEIDQKARNMRDLRKKLVAYAWSVDYSLKRAVLLAEKRLLTVLQNDNVKRDVDNQCGRSTLEVNAFWTVIYAAVAAWEERGRENPQLVNVDTQRVLTEAASACRTSKTVLNRLSPCLQATQNILASADPQVQKDIVDQLDDQAVVELITHLEAVKLLPSQAYGGLASRISAIVDYVRQAKYNLEPLILDPLRFTPAQIVRGSKLVEFSRRSGSRKQV